MATLSLYFFIAAQIAQVAQAMLLKWARQLGLCSSNKEIRPKGTVSVHASAKYT